MQFHTIVDIIYNLPLDEKIKLKNLLEHNIADARRNEMVSNYKQAQEDEKAKMLKFSSNIEELKQMLWWKFHLVNASFFLYRFKCHSASQECQVWLTPNIYVSGLGDQNLHLQLQTW